MRSSPTAAPSGGLALTRAQALHVEEDLLETLARPVGIDAVRLSARAAELAEARCAVVAAVLEDVGQQARAFGAPLKPVEFVAPEQVLDRGPPEPDVFRVIPATRSRGPAVDVERIVVKINGHSIAPQVVRGFAKIDREWRQGDAIEVTLPMPVRRVVADDRVQDDAGRVALQRGPVVYAAEWPDNGGRALNIVVPDSARLQGEFRSGLLNGVAVVTGRVQAVDRGPGGSVRVRPHELVAIPYYAWANRGMGEMQVWLPRQAEKARATPVVPPDPVAAVRSSGGIEKKWTGYNDQNDDIAAIYDGVNPLSSADESNLYFRMRPPVGQPAWVEYEFRKPVTITASDVYFVDDRRFCRLPASWRLVYREGGQWKTVAARGPYTVLKDQFNHADFRPVTTTAVRIEVEPATHHYASGEIGPPDAMFLSRHSDWREFGLIEWRVK
jgi:hypothetical protein